MLSAEKTNRILSVLTIWFTFSIPPVIVGTFYGMNINLPGGIEVGGLNISWNIYNIDSSLDIISSICHRYVSVLPESWMAHNKYKVCEGKRNAIQKISKITVLVIRCPLFCYDRFARRKERVAYPILDLMQYQEDTAIVAGPEFPTLLVRSIRLEPIPNGRMLPL